MVRAMKKDKIRQFFLSPYTLIVVSLLAGSVYKDFTSKINFANAVKAVLLFRIPVWIVVPLFVLYLIGSNFFKVSHDIARAIYEG